MSLSANGYDTSGEVDERDMEQIEEERNSPKCFDNQSGSPTPSLSEKPKHEHRANRHQYEFE
jgi:hypothetical protein